jgi:iron complex transport system substrate-binding protein
MLGVTKLLSEIVTRGQARLLRTLLALGLAAAVLAAACGEGEEEAATPTVSAPESPSAEPTPAGTEYPLTVTDMLERSVTIDAAPEAVAALSPTTVEYVYAVGATSLTRTSSVRYPEAATSATDIGPSYQPNFELVAAQSPDLIIADSVLQPHLAQNLEALNVPVVYAGAESFADVLAGLRLVGLVLDRSGEADAVVSDLEQRLADLQADLPAEKPTVLILNGTPADFFSAKPESYVGNLVDLLGGVNVAAGAPDVGRFPGYTKLSLETIVESAPEVVLATSAGAPGATTITESLAENPAWADVPAVQNERVYEIDKEIYLQAPGPRVGEALDNLAKLLYPEAFAP